MYLIYAKPCTSNLSIDTHSDTKKVSKCAASHTNTQYAHNMAKATTGASRACKPYCAAHRVCHASHETDGHDAVERRDEAAPCVRRLVLPYLPPHSHRWNRCEVLLLTFNPPFISLDTCTHVAQGMVDYLQSYVGCATAHPKQWHCDHAL